MSNWEEIEKQVKRYAYAARIENNNGMYDCLANIKGIVEAMESQIPKVCSHGVSMQEPCDLCSSEAERGVMTISSPVLFPERGELKLSGPGSKHAMANIQPDLVQPVDKNVCDYIAASSSYDLAQRPKVCSHGVNMTEDCEKCGTAWQVERLTHLRSEIQKRDGRIAELEEHALANIAEPGPQNERIGQLSERIEQLESDLKKAFLYCTEINNKLDRFMDMCEENGKKREERIKELERRADYSTDWRIRAESVMPVLKRDPFTKGH